MNAHTVKQVRHGLLWMAIWGLMWICLFLLAGGIVLAFVS